jgi:DNA-binding response OmpR family regulator
MKNTVLIVDDNHDAADSFATLLNIQGHRTWVAYDSESGYDLAYEASPDIIFHDIELPLMDGYSAARKLRAEARFAKTVLVALTAYGNEADKIRASLAGFDAHMTKPINFDHLRIILDRVKIS